MGTKYHNCIVLKLSSPLQTKFDTAAAEVKQLKAKPTDKEMLQVYSLFKQASVGDVDTGETALIASCCKYTPALSTVSTLTGAVVIN